MTLRPTGEGRGRGRWPGELTGRQVFAMLLGFFLLIIAVNGVFIYLSLSSHPGTTTRDAYREGLEYNRVLERAARQQSLRWQARILAEGGTVSLELTDAGGRAVRELAGTVQAVRPTRDGEDRSHAAVETAPGTYGVEGPPLAPGRWTVVFELEDGAGRRFRAENAILVTR